MRSTQKGRTARFGGIAAAAVLTSGLPCVAQGQTIPVNTPLSVPVAGNVDRLRIVPVVTTVYDDNVLRTNDQRTSGPRDNFRVSPAVAIDVNRLFGRTRFAVGGTLGYDFNTRFGQLDRERINLTSSVTAPIGSPCSFTGSAAFERAQFDLGDTDTLVSQTNQRQTYDLSATCSRSAGFYPEVGGNVTSVANTRRPALDSRQSGVRAGIGYARPSLGTLQLVGAISEIERPGVRDLTGIDDSTTITDIRMIFARSIAPRVGFRLGAGVTHADPRRATVSSFTGPSYDGEITIRPVPRFTIVASAQRLVQNQSGFTATYVVADAYRASATYQLSARSTGSLFVQRLKRDPRGEDLLQPTQQRGSDTTKLAGGTYSFDFHTSLRMNVSVIHRELTAQNAFYDYKSTSGSAGISARF